VTEDDPRYQDWPSRKPTAQEKKVNQVIADPVGVATREAVKAGTRASGKVGRKVAAAATALAARYGMTVAGVAARATLLGAAGFAAYWITRKLQTVRWTTYDDLQYDLANRVRHARQAAAAEYGRPLTPEEIKAIDTWYRATRSRIQEMQARGVPLSTFRFGD